MPPLCFAAIAPHGSMAILEACEPGEENLALTTREAMNELGRRFDAAAPDAVIVITPHNVHLDGRFGVLLGAHLEGELEGAPSPVRLSVPIDDDLAMRCISAMRDAGVPCAGVSYGANDLASAVVPMDWGTLVPLWFMGGRSRPTVPVVVVTPSRRLTALQHIEAGRALAAAAGASLKRVALIASADHGHGHQASGPYGFHPASRDYDERVVELVRKNRLGMLSDFKLAFLDHAQMDSWWQMLMLHGAVGDGCGVEVLSYEAPTYFGMMCAHFDPQPGAV
ncbi:MAG: DODA-type extradiol aromatic ring-opening family dioxygenase [Candidatus Dormibacteria bacterium]